MKVTGEDLWTEKLAEFYQPMDRITAGPGEDCVHISEIVRREMVVSVDAHYEGTHFTMDIVDLRDIGHRSLALALSDLAAVGATPLTYMVNLEVPEYLTLDNTLEIYKGFEKLNNEYCISPSGGNLVRGPRCGLTIVVIGEVERGKGLLRSKAQEGDLLVVTGDLGRSLAGYEILTQEDLHASLAPDIRNPLIQKFRQPWPRIKDMLYILRLAKVNGAIDITDGLGKDLMRMARMSDVEIVIEEEKLPIHPALAEFSRVTHRDLSSLVLASGEELEVAFTMPPEEFEKIRDLRVPVTVIGEVRTGFAPGVLLRRKGGEEIPIGDLGYDHFEKA